MRNRLVSVAYLGYHFERRKEAHTLNKVKNEHVKLSRPSLCIFFIISPPKLSQHCN